jgi:hypothetical protein
MRLTVKLLAVCVLLCSFVVLPAAQDLKSVLDGGKLPQKIKPTDIGDDMRAVKISHEKQGGGDLFSMMMNPMFMMMGMFSSLGGAAEKTENPTDAAAATFFDRLGISWTNGSTVEMYGERFLVTYAVQMNMGEVMKSKNPPDLSKMDLILTLVNTKSIASVTPRLDMTKEEWLKPAPPITGSAGGDPKASSTSNAKQLGTALMIYTADYDDIIPYVQSTKGAFEVLMPYMKNVEITKSLNPAGSKFLLNMAVAGAAMNTIEEPSKTVLFYEDKPWEDGTRIVVFCDTSTKNLTEEQWQAVQTTLNLKIQKVGRPLPATLGANWPPVKSVPSRASGEIGRRTGFRFQRVKP